MSVEPRLSISAAIPAQAGIQQKTAREADKTLMLSHRSLSDDHTKVKI